MSRFVSRFAAAPRLPLPATERLIALDVLRGLALLGVLLANITEIVSYGVVATSSQMEALASAPLDHVTDLLVSVLITDKARVVLSILFGAGFILLYSKYLEEGRPALRLYVWRMGVLFLIGLIHLVFLWTWDILTVYAIAGLGLVLVARWGVRALWVGAAIGLISVQIDWWNLFGGLDRFSDISTADVDYDRPVLALQALSRDGDYAGLVAYFWEDTHAAFADGSFFYGVAATFPLMMVGAALMKMGWLRRPDEHRGAIGLWGLALVSLGLLLQLVNDEFMREIVPLAILHFIRSIPFMDYAWLASSTVLGMGYLLVALWCVAGLTQARSLSGVLRAFGRMALTNYITQSVFIGWLLFGVGPGLGLAGSIGSALLFCIGVGFFWLQAIASVYWLRAFGIGPVEYIWRVSSGQGLKPARSGAGNGA